MSRNVTAEPLDPRERYALYRLCDCPTCEGSGKAEWTWNKVKCPDCRGEGRIRQEVASCETPEALGVALVTLAREGEWSECPFGLLDRMPECERCNGTGKGSEGIGCLTCRATGVKPTGTWLISPWLPSARNVTDAARTLARSKKSTRPERYNDIDERTER